MCKLSTIKVKSEEVSNNNNNNNNNNKIPIIKKISYASVVKGDIKLSNKNKTYSNLKLKKSTEQIHTKSTFGNLNKDKIQKSIICKDEYPSLSESQTIDNKSRKKTKHNGSSEEFTERKYDGEKKSKEQNANHQNQTQTHTNTNTNTNTHTQSTQSKSKSKSPSNLNHSSSSQFVINDNSSKKLLENDEYQQFLTAYIISIKLLDDNNWKNISWSKSTKISLRLINLWELCFLKNINYNLYISENEYNQWFYDFEKYRKESREFIMFLHNNNYWLNFNNNFNALNINSYNYGAIKDYYYCYINNNGNPFIYSESPRNELSTFVNNPYSLPVSVNYLGPSNSYDNLFTLKNNFNSYNFSKNYKKKRNTKNNNNNYNKLKDYQSSLEFNNKIYPYKKAYQAYNNTIPLNKIIKKNGYYLHYNS